MSEQFMKDLSTPGNYEFQSNMEGNADIRKNQLIALQQF